MADWKLTLTNLKRRASTTVRRGARGVIRALLGTQGLWKHALPGEVKFWDAWLSNQGFAEHHWDYCGRLDPDRALNEEIVELLSAPVGAEVRILDVGAGPLTNLGKCWEGRRVIITAVDPLAAQYDRILSKYRIIPLVRTRPGHAERLLEIFPEDHFDLACATNSLDHSYDPVLAIRQMLAVTRPGGYVYLRHRVNEGESRRYGGLHQWNFYSQQGCFFVGNRKRTVNLTAELDGLAEVCCKLEAQVTSEREYQHIVGVLRKRLHGGQLRLEPEPG